MDLAGQHATEPGSLVLSSVDIASIVREFADLKNVPENNPVMAAFMIAQVGGQPGNFDFRGRGPAIISGIERRRSECIPGLLPVCEP